MIHSVHIIGSRQLGGAEHFYFRFVQGLMNSGYPVLAVNRPDSPVSRVLDPQVQQVHIPMVNGYDVLSLMRIRRLIREVQPLVVQTYMGRATRLTRTPRGGATIHVARLGGYYKVKGYYGHAHAWVANTRGLCDYLIRQGLAAERVYRIGNFVEPAPPASEKDLQALHQSLQIPEDALIVFSLGRFIDIKGFDDLLKAFDRLHRDIRGRPVYLVIAGDGPLRNRLHTLGKALNLDARLRWVGWLDNPGPYYHLADVFVSASLRETLGNVILEAWAHGLPVVATRTPGALELIIDGENGLMAPIRAPEELAARTGELLAADLSVRQGMAHNGLKTLQENHTREAVIQAYLDMYADVHRKVC
jgi:glycosyltransferase involved in cell wall biosynthesis